MTHRICYILFLGLILCTTSVSAQFWPISSRHEGITATTHTDGIDLYRSSGFTTYRYNDVMNTWDSIMPMQILAIRGPSMILRNAQHNILFSDNSGRSTRFLSVPFRFTSRHPMTVSGDSIAVISDGRLFITTNGGRTDWRYFDTLEFIEAEFDYRVYWYDSLLMVTTPYPAISHSFFTLDGRRDVLSTDWRISSVVRTTDHFVFNYQGRLSRTRQHVVTDTMFTMDYLDMAAAQLGSVIIVFSPSGKQYITRDSGNTWSADHIFPEIYVDSLRSFEHGDSVYVYLGAQNGWWSIDTSLREWSRVTYNGMSHSSAFANVDDTLLVWTKDIGLLRFSRVDLSSRPTLMRPERDIPIAMFTTNNGVIIAIHESYVEQSRDGGRSWIIQSTTETITSGGYSDGIAWMAGDSLYLSNDDGETWITTSPSTIEPGHRSIIHHNHSSLIQTDRGAFIAMPHSDIISTVLPSLSLPRSYAFFDGVPFIATTSTLYRFQNGRWFSLVDDVDGINHGTLQANDRYYYGTDTASRPLRWRPGTTPEVLDTTTTIIDPKISFTGQYVVYTSRESGTYVYNSNTISSATAPADTSDVRREIVMAHGSIDLTDVVTQFTDPPNVTVINLAGRVVHSQRDSWIVHTDMLSQGMYFIILSDSKTQTSITITTTSH